MPRDQQKPAETETPDPQQSADTSEFDTAWEEFTKESDAAPSERDRAETDADDPDQPADTANGDDTAADAGDGAEAATDEPSSQQTDDSGPQGATRDRNNQGSRQQADPWAELPPEARARAERLEQENQRHRGNQAALQRELARIRKQYPDTGGQPASGGKTAASEARTDGQTSADDPTQSDDWKKLRDEYPELLGPVEQMFQRMDQKLQSLEQGHTQVSGYVQDQQLQRNYDTVAESHEDFAAFTAAPEDDPWARSYGEALQAWTAQQPEEVQAIVQRNAEDIYDPAKVDWVLQQFKASDVYRQMVGEPGSAQTQTQPSAKTQQGQAGKDEISERRKRRLDSAPAVSGKGPGAATGAPDDFDAAFDHYAQQIERTRRR